MLQVHNSLNAAHPFLFADFLSDRVLCRYYRAPELIFGATDYSPAIDVWSAGCVVAELLIGCPIFPGSSGVDQLVEIIKVTYNL